MSSLLADPAMPPLVTIPNIELVAVGEWETATTGTAVFTERQLAAAVAALEDPCVKSPRLRVGHTAPDVSIAESAGGFADQPAFGRFTNLRLADNGTKIVADLVGVPGWLTDVLPAAYPSRSVEAYYDVTTAAGRKHDMVITSVALLGVSLPAVQTLEDLRLAFGAEMPDGVEINGTRVMAKGGPMPERISASVTYTDVRRSFYEDFATDEAGRYWWWICDFVMEPQTVIADDDEGGLWAVPYSIRNDAVTWGDPVEVRIQYVEKDSGKVAASRLASAAAHAFASAAESRPKDRARAANPTTEGAEMTNISTALLEKLGIDAEATEEEQLAALEAYRAEHDEEEPQPDEDPGTETDEPEAEGSQLPVAASVDPDALRRLQEDARLGRDARTEQLRLERETLVDDRIEKGAIASATRSAHLAELNKGGEIEKAHRSYLASLTEGVIPVEERGIAPSEEDITDATHAQIMGHFGVRQYAGKES